MTARKVLGIVGWKNSGKTTLVEALVCIMTTRGLCISTVKHAHHAFDIDIPGKDCYRHREAGAGEVLVASAQRWVLQHELRGAAEPALDTLIAKLAPCDLVLGGGFKDVAYPKIEVVRFRREEGLIADRDKDVIAIATDDALLAPHHTTLPLNDAATIAEFIFRRFGIQAGT